jgi:hypothetical protein
VGCPDSHPRRTARQANRFVRAGLGAFATFDTSTQESTFLQRPGRSQVESSRIGLSQEECGDAPSGKYQGQRHNHAILQEATAGYAGMLQFRIHLKPYRHRGHGVHRENKNFIRVIPKPKPVFKSGS